MSRTLCLLLRRDAAGSLQHRFRVAWLMLVAIAGLAGCSSRPASTALPRSPAPAADAAPVLLISMDGFRWDYLELYPEQTRRIRSLAERGVRAEALIPVFPSNTFANHYSIATGLYPSNHGIINNIMFDPRLGEYFRYNQPKYARDPRWWEGEPIWITAVKQGRASACSFWVGSETEIDGLRPTYWKPYNYSIPFAARLEEVVSWLKAPAAQRPAVITFYLEETNSVGHRAGPRSPEMAAALALTDYRIGLMIDRFAAEQTPVNFVLVSDHGMAPCGPERVLLFDDYVDLARIQIDFDESVAGIRPAEGGSVEALLAALRRMPHARVFRASELPAHLRVDPHHPRVPPVWILPDEGWNIMTRAAYERARPQFSRGQHGYDPALPSMHGLFIASGPAFAAGRTVPPVENVHVYNLLCAVAGLTPAPNDGDDRLVQAARR